jgi:hypothetical protein
VSEKSKGPWVLIGDMLHKVKSGFLTHCGVLVQPEDKRFDERPSQKGLCFTCFRAHVDKKGKK